MSSSPKRLLPAINFPAIPSFSESKIEFEFKSGKKLNMQKTKEAAEDKIRERIRKIARSNFRMAVFGLVVSITAIVLMVLWKKDLETAMVGREEFKLFNMFFALENWKQWTFVSALAIWSVFELGFTFHLKKFVFEESAKNLKIWIIVDFLACILIGVFFISIMYHIDVVLQIIIGVFIGCAYLYEIYFVRILYKFIKIISASHTYEEDEDEF